MSDTFFGVDGLLCKKGEVYHMAATRKPWLEIWWNRLFLWEWDVPRYSMMEFVVMDVLSPGRANLRLVTRPTTSSVLSSPGPTSQPKDGGCRMPRRLQSKLERKPHSSIPRTKIRIRRGQG